MNKKIKIHVYTILLISLFPSALQAQAHDEAIALDEVVVASKEGQELRKIPTSVSIFSEAKIENERIGSVRGLSASVPNLFIPDYGSKYTSAIYIRGVGSRLGNSAIGMYVDNVPYLDKTSFDFDFFDISRVEVLRGPQGTLYGRNSMGGLINIYTLSPWDFQGTKVKLSSGNYGQLRAQLSHYAKLSDKFAFSLGGNYAAAGGFYHNTNPAYNPDYSNASGKIFHDVGATQSASLRTNLGWRPSAKLSLNYIGSYEYTDQNGYAYGKYNRQTNLPDTIDYNDFAFYSRNLLHNSLRVEYQAKNFTIASTTGHQFLKDSLLLDQDFSPASMFTLRQDQKLNAITEEITIRSTGSGKFQWIGGVSGFYQNLNTGSLVTFKEDGVASIESNINKLLPPMPPMPPMHLSIDTNRIPVVGEYTTQNHGVAAFVQPTFNNFLIKGLSLSAGLRWDYEQASLEHYTHSVYAASMHIGGILAEKTVKSDTIAGNEKMDFTQLLPKFSIRYEKNGNILYVSASKGYKAGGYNLQMFSDLIETKMRSTRPVALDIQQSTSFKPEYSWNYEAGGRFALWNKKANAGITLFLLDIRDQQIAEFAPNGQGRMIKNAGESQSRGVEFDATIYPLNGFRIGVSYGFTESKFTSYKEQIDSVSFIDYSGKYVPFVPRQTASLTVDYTWHFANSWIDRLSVGGQYSGAGKIYWTEANDASQDFYSLVNGKVSVEKGNIALSVWGKNLLNAKYSTFYFETFGNAFGQLGRPLYFGIDLSLKF